MSAGPMMSSKTNGLDLIEVWNREPRGGDAIQHAPIVSDARVQASFNLRSLVGTTGIEPVTPTMSR